MSVKDDRQATAAQRRANIVAALRSQTDLRDKNSATSVLKSLVDKGGDRRLIVSADIDGLVSSMMLAQATGWRAAALIESSETVRLHPRFKSVDSLLKQGAGVFGVDVFSTRFPNASNHPVLWGGGKIPKLPAATGITSDFDGKVRRRSRRRGVVFLNPSFWVGIEAARTTKSNPRCVDYKYPLGTAQHLLACLEVIGRTPRLFDREYVPWLIANCDGGLESIGTYHFNVPMWWSALAAAAGPGSLSEQVFEVARTQSPTDFPNAVSRLGHESPEVANVLSPKWNLLRPYSTSIPIVTDWLSQLSGWPDPFLGGASSIGGWNAIKPKRDSVALKKILGKPPRLKNIRRHLNGALNAIYFNFTAFREGQKLGWMLAK